MRREIHNIISLVNNVGICGGQRWAKGIGA